MNRPVFRETVFVVGPFVIVTVAPVRKFDPKTVTGRAAVFAPKDGSNDAIDGPVPVAITVKQFGFVAFGPPGLVTVRV